MTARRSFLPRTDACCVCGGVVRSLSATTTDPEAPEMIGVSDGTWIGVIRDEPGGEVRIIFCCSQSCLMNLLREEP